MGFRDKIVKNSISRKTAFYGVFAALAIGLSYLERLIPPIAVPGVKLGISNVVSLMGLFAFGPAFAFFVTLTRIAITGLLFSGLSGIIYSAAGGILSFVMMCAAKKTKLFGVMGVSIIGGVFHNLGQIIVAALVVDNLKMFYYLPVLIVSGALAGAATGAAAGYSLKHLKG